MKTLYLSVLTFVCCIFEVNAQVLGTILDEKGKVVSGAEIISMSDPSKHVVSEKDGTFYLEVLGQGYVLVKVPGKEYKYATTGGEQTFKLSERALVDNTGFSEKNSISKTQAISSVHSDFLSQFNDNSVWQSLYGTLPGLTVLQQLGWNATPTLYMRGGATFSGKAPLIIVDGFVRGVDKLSMEEVESVSVLKDGAATALYGAQGANGVIVFTTKRGAYKTRNVEVDYKFGLGLPWDMPSFVDAATYAYAMNEALVNDGLPKRYTDREIDAFRSGKYPELYPDVDWMDVGLRDFTTNHQFGVSFNGGGDNVRYYTYIDYQNGLGLLKNTDLNEKYSTQMRKNKLSARVNLDLDLTKSTRITLNLFGNLGEDHTPSTGSPVAGFYKVPSSAFPIKTESGHWGASDKIKSNPVADVADVGYSNSYSRELQSDIRLKQDFSRWVKGLSAEVAVAYDNRAVFRESNKKTYSYEVLVPVLDDTSGEILSVSRNVFGEDKSLTYSSSLSGQRMSSTLEGRISYDRTIRKHGINTAVIYRQESSVPLGKAATRKYQSMMILGTYNYADRYIFDLVANYYGSSVLPKGDRFDLYPAVSAAWVVSNENFLNNCATIDLLKLRLSYGRSGFNSFGYDLDQQYYTGGNGYYFTSSNKEYGGMKLDVLPVKDLTSQLSERGNVGLDISLFSSLSVTMDVFHERRSRILQSAGSLYSSVLGTTTSQKCDGMVDAMGGDGAINYKGNLGEFRYNLGGSFSFVTTEVKQYHSNVEETYTSKIGKRLGQFFGLEAIGFFQDEEDIKTSPKQTFSAVQPGDVKYKDQNGDKKINSNDFRAFGYSTLMPEIYYGINIGFAWRNIGLDMQFQGTGNYSAVLKKSGLYQPMSGGANLSEWYWSENVRWTENTKQTANLPRLTTLANQNNTEDSTFWLADASYFTLRNVYLYYNLPQKLYEKMKLSGLQIYLKGENLFRIDKIKYSNPDHIGALYPDMRMLYAGINIKF